MRATRRTTAGLTCAAIVAIACGCGSRNPEVASPAPAPGVAAAGTSPDASPAECALVLEPGEPISTVALAEDVSAANAPRPSNESERLLFRQLYDTLLRIDCTGRLVAGLASSWRIHPDGRGWVITLREDARFSDGTPVRAAAVLAGWSRGNGDELHPAVGRLVQSVVELDERMLAITLRDARTDAPVPLAHADLAIAREIPRSRWPLGTRGARIAPDQESPAPDATAAVDLVRDAPPDRPSDLARIRFLVAPNRDARDLLDQGVDLLLTRDPAALEYAGTLPQYLAVPLPWQRTHVLLAPGRSRSSQAPASDARNRLALDAVRGEARGADAPFWWQRVPDCEIPVSDPRIEGSPTSGRIVYDRDDATARELAERLVGLASASSPDAAMMLTALLPERSTRRFQRAVGLSGNALAAARRRGSDAAYIVALDRRPLDPCGELQSLVAAMGWLDPESIVPLVDTRRRAILRRGHSGAAVDWDGQVVLAGQ